MKIHDLLWKIDLWLLDFEGEVDAHFGAGNAERGMAAFKQWHEEVRRGMQPIDNELAANFSRIARNLTVSSPSGSVTPRTQFMRTCGGRSKRFLKDMKKRAINGTLKIGPDV